MKILAVDDVSENRYLLEQLLGAKGHEVVGAVDGVDAIEKLGGGGFDLIIADIMMPRMDGFELCFNLKLDPKLRSMPFIFYTATYTTDDDRAFALSLGADGFILKPEAPEAFVRTLNQVLADTARTRVVSTPARLRPEQVEFLRAYNARLITKLQQKVSEARDANQKLNELNCLLEDRVREKTAALERSNRELKSFAYTLSHDLRSPLRAIAGYSDALRESAAVKLTAEERILSDKVAAAIGRMERLIQDMLDYSALGPPVACARVEVDALVRDIAESNPSFHGRIEFVNTLAPAIAHAPSLRQAVDNLFSNAMKFVAPGVEPRVRVRTEPRGDDVRLWVEDNGIGIAPEDQPKLFQIFSRLHPHYAGSGIGLAIVARAVERMHGELGLESEPGRGTRFWIQLPRAD